MSANGTHLGRKVKLLVKLGKFANIDFYRAGLYFVRVSLAPGAPGPRIAINPLHKIRGTTERRPEKLLNMVQREDKDYEFDEHGNALSSVISVVFEDYEISISELLEYDVYIEQQERFGMMGFGVEDVPLVLSVELFFKKEQATPATKQQIKDMKKDIRPLFPLPKSKANFRCFSCSRYYIHFGDIVSFGGVDEMFSQDHVGSLEIGFISIPMGNEIIPKGTLFRQSVTETQPAVKDTFKLQEKFFIVKSPISVPCGTSGVTTLDKVVPCIYEFNMLLREISTLRLSVVLLHCFMAAVRKIDAGIIPTIGKSRFGHSSKENTHPAIAETEDTTRQTQKGPFSNIELDDEVMDVVAQVKDNKFYVLFNGETNPDKKKSPPGVITHHGSGDVADSSGKGGRDVVASLRKELETTFEDLNELYNNLYALKEALSLMVAELKIGLLTDRRMRLERSLLNVLIWHSVSMRTKYAEKTLQEFSAIVFMPEVDKIICTPSKQLEPVTATATMLTRSSSTPTLLLQGPISATDAVQTLGVLETPREFGIQQNRRFESSETTSTCVQEPSASSFMQTPMTVDAFSPMSMCGGVGQKFFEISPRAAHPVARDITCISPRDAAAQHDRPQHKINDGDFFVQRTRSKTILGTTRESMLSKVSMLIEGDPTPNTDGAHCSDNTAGSGTASPNIQSSTDPSPSCSCRPQVSPDALAQRTQLGRDEPVTPSAEALLSSAISPAANPNVALTNSVDDPSAEMIYKVITESGVEVPSLGRCKNGFVFPSDNELKRVTAASTSGQGELLFARHARSLRSVNTKGIWLNEREVMTTLRIIHMYINFQTTPVVRTPPTKYTYTKASLLPRTLKNKLLNGMVDNPDSVALCVLLREIFGMDVNKAPKDSDTTCRVVAGIEQRDSNTAHTPTYLRDIGKYLRVMNKEKDTPVSHSTSPKGKLAEEDKKDQRKRRRESTKSNTPADSPKATRGGASTHRDRKNSTPTSPNGGRSRRQSSGTVSLSSIVVARQSTNTFEELRSPLLGGRDNVVGDTPIDLIKLNRREDKLREAAARARTEVGANEEEKSTEDDATRVLRSSNTLPERRERFPRLEVKDNTSEQETETKQPKKRSHITEQISKTIRRFFRCREYLNSNVGFFDGYGIFDPEDRARGNDFLAYPYMPVSNPVSAVPSEIPSAKNQQANNGVRPPRKGGNGGDTGSASDRRQAQQTAGTQLVQSTDGRLTGRFLDLNAVMGDIRRHFPFIWPPYNKLPSPRPNNPPLDPKLGLDYLPWYRSVSILCVYSGTYKYQKPTSVGHKKVRSGKFSCRPTPSVQSPFVGARKNTGFASNATSDVGVVGENRAHASALRDQEDGPDRHRHPLTTVAPQKVEEKLPIYIVPCPLYVFVHGYGGSCEDMRIAKDVLKRKLRQLSLYGAESYSDLESRPWPNCTPCRTCLEKPMFLVSSANDERGTSKLVIQGGRLLTEILEFLKANNIRIEQPKSTAQQKQAELSYNGHERDSWDDGDETSSTTVRESRSSSPSPSPSAKTTSQQRPTKQGKESGSAEADLENEVGEESCDEMISVNLDLHACFIDLEEEARKLRESMRPSRHSAVAKRPENRYINILTHITFIGHSMGGLVIRQCVSLPPFAPLLPLLDTFVTLSTPHLGTATSKRIVSNGLQLLQGVTRQECIGDMTGLGRDSFLGRLARESSSLSSFRCICLVGVAGDGYSGLSSSLACNVEGVGPGGVQGLRYSRMMNDLNKSLSETYCRRLALVLHSATSRNEASAVDRLVGREWHIRVLADWRALARLFDVVFE